MEVRWSPEAADDLELPIEAAFPFILLRPVLRCMIDAHDFNTLIAKPNTAM
jgi:hypothetical protein